MKIPQFRLLTLMLGIAVVAIVLAALRLQPGTLVGLVFLVGLAGVVFRAVAGLVRFSLYLDSLRGNPGDRAPGEAFPDPKSSAPSDA